ncbi:arylesterase [Novosphingobium sp.]|uniref:arylesterase n=1 Tax=Novosphingobium sp. TaxID=1874826 RepID=UPI0025CE086B|nr:arylesterase [Novosphingobium sp.]
MKLYVLSALVLTAFLAGCGSDSISQPAAPFGSGSASSVIDGAPPSAVAIPARAPVILAFGDSLYAGYQLGPHESYPARLEAALAARGHPMHVVNAGVSGDTTADGKARLAFTLDNQPRQPVLVLLGLGGNDMLRGLPPEQAEANLDAIMAELAKRKIPVMLTGMLAAPNLGKDYVNKFNQIYPALALKYQATLVPFLLQPIVGHPEWQLPDHIHPNARGVDKVVDGSVGAVLKALKPPEDVAD